MSESKLSAEKKPICFVLMPIADSIGYESGHFGRVYEFLLKPAIIMAGYIPIRADDAVKTDYIVVGIIQKIVESDMVLCDYSSRNPNVMYELGIRHAFNKPVVLIKDRKTDKIFDIQGLRYAEYDESLRVDSVKKEIAKISAAISETATCGAEDMNSVVQLAGIKTATLPNTQTISADTRLILTAVRSLEGRMQEIEDAQVPAALGHFYVGDDSIELSNGDVVEIGSKLFRKGVEVGVLIAVNPKAQSIGVEKDGILQHIASASRMAKDITDIPF